MFIFVNCLSTVSLYSFYVSNFFPYRLSIPRFY